MMASICVRGPSPPGGPASLPPAVLVLGIKGGAGKSSVALATALELARRGKRVGILDTDLDSPYLGELVAKRGLTLSLTKDRLFRPAAWQAPSGETLRVISWSLYTGEVGAATLMTGEAHRQFVRDAALQADWGNADVLLCDVAAGSGDEHRAARDALGDRVLGVIAVVQPIEENVLERVWDLCAHDGLRLLGVISNMDGSLAPSGKPAIDPVTLEEFYPLGRGVDVAAWCRRRGVRFLGKLPMCPLVREAQAKGDPRFPEAMMGPIREAALVIAARLPFTRGASEGWA